MSRKSDNILVDLLDFRSDHQCGQIVIFFRFFSARIRSPSKPYQRRSPMRSDHHSGLRSNFCGKTANSLSSLRSNGYFQYIVMIILRGDFYIEKLSPMFSTHVHMNTSLNLHSHLPFMISSITWRKF